MVIDSCTVFKKVHNESIYPTTQCVFTPPRRRPQYRFFFRIILRKRQSCVLDINRVLVLGIPDNNVRAHFSKPNNVSWTEKTPRCKSIYYRRTMVRNEESIGFTMMFLFFFFFVCTRTFYAPTFFGVTVCNPM